VLPGELERYIHEHIPLSQAMAVTVVSVADDAVVLRAPLGPNINHRRTAFGGSAASLALLAGWSLLHVRLHAAGISDRLVIQRSAMEYRMPITAAFTARASLEQPERWPQFLAMLERRGRARVTVAAVLEQDGQAAGVFSGEFVALAAGSDG
jgi:thioesterase domain-containing protein